MEQKERSAPFPEGPGTVTRLVRQQHDPERVSVFIDDAFAFGVHLDLVVRFGLHKGQVLGAEAQRQIVDADRMRAANLVALEYLGYRARTEHEVRRKLVRSAFDEDVVERTVARLREGGYVDDAAYAHTYAEARFRNRGYGPARLRGDLLRRGVDGRLIDAALDALAERVDVLAAARRHAEKCRPRLLAESNPRKRRKKLADYLLRRGFTYETARRIVEEMEPTW